MGQDDGSELMMVALMVTVGVLAFMVIILVATTKDTNTVAHRIEDTACAQVTAQVENAWLAARQARDSLTILQGIIANRDEQILNLSRLVPHE